MSGLPATMAAVVLQGFGKAGALTYSTEVRASSLCLKCTSR